ncbi:V-type ATP synthase subunit I [Maledivibacter halophilus]|uniref:V/A-type H+-transporting ATPase subunit I n=1 Tax=Maledivibacter halophilus TaxID=36842 RepID=A0A1T5JZ31_9FIRM|nr:V-type ATPase 116kDa subunit family protein [Maledivibacter halophilus]SKC56737.1 V/A-type H+-transporting ATPase subunit I [Maledivibacter halophilus]
MTVAKMEMLNLVAPIRYIDKISREIVLLENIHMVNALNEINEDNFTLSIAEENIEELVDMCVIKAYREERDYKDISEKINNLMDYLQIEKNIKRKYIEEEYDFETSIGEIEDIYEDIEGVYREKTQYHEELKRIKEFDSHIHQLRQTNANLSILKNLHFFSFKIGILSKENINRLKKNYENISAIVLHIGSNEKGEVYLVISPKDLETETNRTLHSVRFYELDIPKEFLGTPDEIVVNIENKVRENKSHLETINNKLEKLKEEYGAVVERAYSRLMLEEEISRVKNETACTQSYFYLSGWVQSSEKERIKDRFRKYGEKVILMFKGVSEVHKYIIPPTKLKNNRLTRPFEALVKMYGVPSYSEMDPTPFLSITYMLLFGTMFGDVGQGLVFLLAGLYLSKKNKKGLYGGILTRLGISSTIFGFLYGSVFGFEHIIPALLVHPIEHIDFMLMGSVVIGIIMLITSFGYSIVNKLKQRDMKEGLFGRNGLNGLIFYLALLGIVANVALDKEIVPSGLLYVIVLISLVLIVIREPLANLILKKRPLYNEEASSYYIESGFDIFETLLSMMSNTISFIRVGAFALNHVGLFIAFQTMAKIVNNFAGSIIIFLIGNIIIICLEGLIVFIQGLRLEYYELFSKYYMGEGIEFRPVRLADN